MFVRRAAPADLDAVTRLEAICFPPAEAATRESFADRLAVFGDRFWLMEEDGRIIAMVNGMLTGEEELRDEMYADSSLHDPDGAWQMIFGVDTDPAYRHRGIALALLRHMLQDCRREGRRGVVLTCKEALKPLYEEAGFTCEGESASTHGGAKWYSMRISF